jgi:D-amino-acid dehydrogenase
MKALVIGAGIVGATTAASLAKKGYEVTVIEQEAPAAGTSHANGGQLSACHTTPWANPGAPLKVLKWALSREESPLVFRPHANLHQLSWLMKFMWNCLPSKTEYNTKSLLKLALHSRDVRDSYQVGMPRYDGLSNGILHFYRTKSELKDAERDTKLMNAEGLDRRSVSVEEAIAIEPALKPIQSELVGATFTPSDSSGDAAEYTRFLLTPEWAIKRGIKGSIRVLKGTVCGLQVHNGMAHVQLCDNATCTTYTLMTADIIVVCAGVWSRELVRPLGIDLNIEPARGFSLTLGLQTLSGKRVKGPHVSLTDDERKLVYSRLGNNLRVAGTAALTGYSNQLTGADKPRIDNMMAAAKQTFGLPDDLTSMIAWSGLRPLTPSNRPYVSATHIPNLYLNTGHGSLGWTLSAGSADLLAGIIEGVTPIDAKPYSLEVPH